MSDVIFIMSIVFAVIYAFIVQHKRMILLVDCIKSLNEAQKALKEQTDNSLKQIDELFGQIFILLDTLQQGMCSVAHKFLYAELRQLKPSEMPTTEFERRNFFKKISLKNYALTRTKIQERINNLKTEQQKQALQMQLSEIDSIHNIVQTLDADSSEDYMKTVMQNVYMCLQKIAELNQSSEEEFDL